MPFASKAEATEIESSHYHNERAVGPANYEKLKPYTTVSANRPNQYDVQYHGLILQQLEPFMILPVTGSAQPELIRFFEYISMNHLNEHYPCKSWQNTLMFFSQTVPSVRYAAMALAAIYRNYLDRGSSHHVHQPQLSKDWVSDKSPLLYYNRAIQLLLSQKSSGAAETTAVTLLVCYLFTCFDHLAGNYVQAVKHLRGGVELSRNIEGPTQDINNSTDDAAGSSGVHTLISQVTRQIRRLDTQAVTFLVDWTPVDIQETFMSQLMPSGSAFQSLHQAADHMQILVAQVMRLHYTERQVSPVEKVLTPSASYKVIILGQLETWSSLFENMMQQRSFYDIYSEPDPLISLLRLHYTMAWTLLSSLGSGGEMNYDGFLPQFQQCVALANDIAEVHKRSSGSPKPTFTPEVGIIPVLFIIGTKCRHPIIRREALSILRRRHIREAVWDSILAARVVERVIEIEEGNSNKETIQSMQQITMSQRIEALSWVHVVEEKSTAKLEITYSFYTQDRIYSESLII